MFTVTTFFRKNWIRVLIASILGIGVMVLYNVSAGDWKELISYSNGAFISGFIWLSVGGLYVVEGFGGLDIFAYLVRRKRNEEGHVESLYEYGERRKEQRKPSRFGFLAYFLVAVIYFLVSLIILIIARTHA